MHRRAVDQVSFALSSRPWHHRPHALLPRPYPYSTAAAATKPAQKAKAKAKPGNPPKSHLPHASPTAKKTSPPASTASSSARAAEPAARAPLGSAAEQLEQAEKIMAMARFHPTLDLWGQHLETLDVHFPTPISRLFSLAAWRADPRGALTGVAKELQDRIKNAISIYRLARINALPHRTIPSIWYRTFNPRRLLGARDPSDAAWLAGVRQEASDTYRTVCRALSKGDKAALKSLTTSAYQKHVLALVARQHPAHEIRWRMHGPVRAAVLSVRATEGYLARDPPRLGNRFLVHVLFKFESVQTLQMFSKTGVLLDERGVRATRQDKPPVPKTVTEYFVVEKRMWYDSPWVLREQMFPSS